MQPRRHLPGPHHPGLSQSQGELSAALDLADGLPVQPLDVLRDVAAFASTATQLSKIAVAPGEHQPWQNDTQRLLASTEPNTSV